MTQSGALNKKIVIGNKKLIKDDEGFQKMEMIPFSRPWAKVTNIDEPIQMNSENESVTKERVTFEIYYRDGISKAMYVSFQGRVYDITAIYNPGFENRMLILTGERDNSRGDLNG